MSRTYHLIIGIVLSFSFNMPLVAQIFSEEYTKYVYPASWSTTTAPYDFKAETHHYINNTYSKQFTCIMGQSFNVTVNYGMGDYFAYFFSESHPELYSYSFSSDVTNTLSLTIPFTGRYRFLLVASGEEGWGVRHVSFNNSEYEMVNIENNCIQCNICTDSIVNIFTWNSSANPKICAVSGTNPGLVIAYNDDYDGSGDVIWGNEARIKGQFSTSVNQIIVFEDYYVPNSSNLNYHPFTDIYIGCKSVLNSSFLYPYYLEDDIIVSAPISTHYNCYSWAGGRWRYWEQPYDIYSQYYSTDTLRAFDNYFLSCGLTRIGATEDNSVVDLWRLSSGNRRFSHASVKSQSNNYALGYGWESKMSSSQRVFHPRYALNGGFGNVYCYYKKIENENYVNGEEIYENIVFNHDEITMLHEQVNAIPTGIIEEFSKAFEIVKLDIYKSQLSDLNCFENNLLYAKLLALCNRYPTLTKYVFLKLNDCELLALKIMEDYFKEDEVGAFKLIREYNDLGNSPNGKKTVHTLFSNAILHAKLLLFAEVYGTTDGFFLKDTTFSTNKDIMNAVTKGNQIEVELNLRDDKFVIINLTTKGGQPINILEEGRKLKSGCHKYTTQVPSSGEYYINCNCNNEIYYKLIKIE